jgi:hypothetical protein
MPLDASYVGRTYPVGEPYEVGREKIRSSRTRSPTRTRSIAIARRPEARLSGRHRAAHLPNGDHCRELAAAAVRSRARADYGRMVHGEQRFAHSRPIRAGDRLAAALTVESIRSIAGNEILGTRTELRDADGELVVTAYATLIVRGSEG